jgi:hypothetical protein
MVRILKDVAIDRGLLQAPSSKYVKEMRKEREKDCRGSAKYTAQCPLIPASKY